MTSSSLFTFSPGQVPIFEGEYYEYWNSQMETFFESVDLWEVINGELTPPDEGDENFAKLQKEFKKKDAKALRYIQQGIGKTIFPRIFGVKSALEAWEILRLEFEGTEKTIALKLQSLWRNFDNLKMGEQEMVHDFSSRTAEIVNQIKSCGDTIEDKRVVGKMLRSLPSKFDHVAAAIEESKDLSKITMYELTGSLLAHEQRINRSSDSLTEQAFESKQVPKSKYNNKGKWRNNNRENKQSQNSDNNGGCIICKKTNHVSKDCFHKCKRCKIPNHSQRDCWFQNKEKNKGKEEAKFSNETKEEILFYSSANQPSKSVWYLDSGCSNHMTGNRDTFVKLDPNITSQIILGDGSRKSGKGKGDIAVQTKEGKEKLITDVLYVPELSHNLLSVGQLMEKNFSFLFDDGRCQIFDKTNKVIVTNIEMKNKTFSLTMPLVEDRALKVDNAELSSLWHLRYGHLHDRALILLKEKNMVIGLPSIEPSGKVCEGCVYGKMHKLPFPKTSWQAKSPLELVHSDICGPMQTPTPGRKRYFILFIDDYTRMMWIYFLNQKSEAFSTFMQFKAQAERESGFLIKSLRTDRGGEYLSNPFSEYCKANGIKRQLTTSYTPQQNGVAERKNRTIVEMARNMLKYKGIPNLYWAEAVHTAAYIMNRSPTKAVHNMTPYEAWHKKKPVVDHFKIFGSLAYALLPSQRREKFDSKGQKLIFIGYSNESKGYRLLDPSTLKIIVSRDVIFDESSSWDFKEKQVVESDYYETPSPTEAGPSQVENGGKHRNEVESDEESPPKKTRPLVEIYERALLAKASNLLQKLSVDPPPKSKDGVEANKQVAPVHIESSNADASKVLVPSLCLSIQSEFMDGRNYYVPACYEPQAYFYGGYDHAFKEWNGYSTYMNQDGMEL
ncbi:hypothetical protein ZIOFF_029198 [Zingiber officinale]|uniref:Integrase catalytic domain-containing protein n=1 Tax=Zingiber officinale TaxID=94328 RepID=A0A8J5GP83_ZINOF|nr:hypothetical protein ZIOFF_029198 [Zingiber officinale]